jgi:hypothetical protein
MICTARKSESLTIWTTIALGTIGCNANQSSAAHRRRCLARGMHTRVARGDTLSGTPRLKGWGGVSRLPRGETRYRAGQDRIARGDVGGSLGKRRLRGRTKRGYGLTKDMLNNDTVHCV